MFGLIEKLRDSRYFELSLIISLFLVACFILSFVSVPVHEYGHHIACSAMGKETKWISYSKVNCIPQPQGLSNEVLLASGGAFSAIIFLVLMKSFYTLAESNKYNQENRYILILFLPVILFQLFNSLIETFLTQYYHFISGSALLSGLILLYFFIVVLWHNRDVLRNF